MTTVPCPSNEPVLSYAPESAERAALTAELSRLKSTPVEIPVRLGGRDLHTGNLVECRGPHDHGQILGRWHAMDRSHVEQALSEGLAARRDWAAMPWQERAAIHVA